MHKEIERSENLEDVECNICVDIMKIDIKILMCKEKIFNLNIYKDDLIGPFADKWMCVPHKCTFNELNLIETFYKNRYLSVECYNEWMSVNGGDYQLGRSGHLLCLWDERLDDFKNMTIDEQITLIDNNIDEIGIFEIVSCNKHGLKHLRIRDKGNLSISRKHFKIVNKFFPFYSDTDKKHTNIDFCTLMYHCFINKYFKEIDFILQICPIGYRNSICVNLLINRLGNEYCDKIWQLMADDAACCMSNDTYKSYFKAISIAIRRNSLWYDKENANLQEVTACASWELSLGRHGMISDWKQEKENRVSKPLYLRLPDSDIIDVHSNDAYIEFAEPIMDDIMRQIMPEGSIWKSWEKFCYERNSWLSSGSAGSKYLERGNKKVRLNKRSYMETIPIKDMVTWIDKEPEIIAIASEKFEMGKARAIYGTEVEDQCLMSYLLNILEPRLHLVDNIECGLVGKKEVLSIIRRMNIVARDKEECTMLDYSDFNLQHTLAIQSLVFKCIKKELIKRNAHQDSITIADWCQRAMMNQKVQFPGDTKAINVVQGLFSGMRGTNFVNTLLNKLYFMVAAKWISINLSIQPVQLYALHHGDDVWVSNKSRLWAITIYKVLQKCGLIFSDKKQIQDMNMAEFLRVVYSKEGARGYLARSIATLIERPLQSELDISPTMKAIGINGQINTCYRRGLNIKCVNLLWDAIIPFALKSEIKGVSSITIPIHLVCRSYNENGLDIGKPKTLPNKCGSIPKIPVMEYKSKFLEEELDKHTTEAFVKVLSDEIKESFNVEAIRRAIHASNVSDSIPQSDKVSSLLKFHRDVNKWRDKCNKMNSIKQCVRSEIDIEMWAVVEGAISFEQELENLNLEWRANIEDIKDESKIEVIMSAIAQSPYKDLSTARRAMGIGVIEAAFLCLHSCKKKELGEIAIEYLSVMLKSISKENVCKMLDVINGFGPSMESWFNPICLSYISCKAIDNATRIAQIETCRTIEQWNNILLNSLELYFKIAMKHGLLLQISHY